MTEIILVDEKDNEVGTDEKLKIHQEGKLHRAFSIFIFNSKKEMLLQKRAKTKYHSAGLWTNACCSHPRPGQNLQDEARRRLKEEMGIETQLRELFSFIYKADLGNLTEYEFDHVFIGKFEGEPLLNKEEADDWKWINVKELRENVKRRPEEYTFWFRLVLDRVLRLT